MERKILIFAARAISAILVAVEAVQTVRKIRDAFRGTPRK
jgi:hypothetical protein